MSKKSEFQLFDNYEEDGQLSLFSPDYDDWDEDWSEDAAGTAESEAKSESVAKPESAAKSVNEAKSESVAGAVLQQEKGSMEHDAKTSVYKKAESTPVQENSGPEIRVKYCSSCGKLLYVREEATGFCSECNNCGIKYFQKQ